MLYTEYYERAHAGAKQMDAGEYDAALETFHALATSDISDLDKSAMCQNIALIYSKMGQHEDALTWYDAAIGLEAPYMRFHAMEQKAAYLGNGKTPEAALPIYEGLYEQPYLTENDKERIWKNIVILRNLRR